MMNFIGKRLFEGTIGLLQKSLDLRTSRHKLLAGNIANAETPSFIPRDVPFEKILKRSMGDASTVGLSKTHRDHFGEEFSTMLQPEPVAGGAGIDQMMARLAENNLRFQADVQVLVKKMEALKLVISEGR